MRRPLVLLVAAAAALLSGCTVTGHVAIEPRAAVVDLRLQHSVESSDGNGTRPCTDMIGIPHLNVTPADAPQGQIACTLTGTLPLDTEESSSVMSLLVASDRLVALSVPPAYLSGSWGSAALTGIDVTVSFPGELITHTGTGTFGGQQVRWNDAQVVRRVGIIAVSRPAGSPPWTLLSYLGTAAAGLALGGGAAWWWRRRDASAPDASTEPAPPTEADADAPREAPPEPTAPQPEDPTVWAPGHADD